MRRRVVRQDSESETINSPGGELTLPARSGEIVTTNNAVSDDELIEAADNNTMFSADQMILPFLKVLQPLSPAVQQGTNEYVPGAKAGSFLNTATQEVYDGTTGIIIVPITHKTSYVEWKSRADGGGLVKDWNDSLDWQNICEPNQRNEYRPVTRNGTEIVKSILHFVLIVDKETGTFTPCVWSFFGTMIKRSKRWATTMQNAMIQTKQGMRNAAHSYYTYKVTTELESNNKGKWYSPKIVPNIEVVDGKQIWVSVNHLQNGRAIWDKSIEYKKSIMEGSLQIGSMEREHDTGAGPTIDASAEERPF